MKHKIILQLILISSLLLCSCGSENINTDETVAVNTDYHTETDDQPFWGGMRNAVATKYGYYFMIDQHLFLYDAKNEKITPLCGRPDCAHKVQADCNANFDGFIDYIGYYQESLYAVKTEDSGAINLYRITPDGSERTKVCELGIMDSEDSGLSFMAAIHRGYFYYTIVTSQMVPVQRTSTAYRISLTDGSYAKKNIFQKEGFGSCIYGFSAYDDEVLFSSATLKADEDGDVGNYTFDDTEYSFYDVKKEKVFGNIVSGSDENTDTLFVKDKKIYYCKDKNLYAYSLQEGTSEKIMDDFFGDTLPTVSYDMKNLYCRDDSSGVVGEYDTVQFKKIREISAKKEWSMLFGDCNYLFALDGVKNQLMVYDKKQGDTWKSIGYNEWIG